MLTSSPITPLLQTHLGFCRAEADLENPHTPSPLDAKRGTNRSISVSVWSVCSFFLWEDTGENIKPCKTISVAEKMLSCLQNRKELQAQRSPPHKLTATWDGDATATSVRHSGLWSQSHRAGRISSAAACHGMAMEGKELLRSRKKTNLENLSETC